MSIHVCVLWNGDWSLCNNNMGCIKPSRFWSTPVALCGVLHVHKETPPSPTHAQKRSVGKGQNPPPPLQFEFDLCKHPTHPCQAKLQSPTEPFLRSGNQ